MKNIARNYQQVRINRTIVEAVLRTKLNATILQRLILLIRFLKVAS